MSIIVSLFVKMLNMKERQINYQSERAIAGESINIKAHLYAARTLRLASNLAEHYLRYRSRHLAVIWRIIVYFTAQSRQQMYGAPVH